MKILGDIQLDPVGGQIANQRLENLGSAPITSTGRIYFNTSTKKVYVWNGTAWIQITSGADYTAGDGLYLDGTNKFHVQLYNGSSNLSGLEFSGGYIKLRVTSEFELDGDGLSLAVGGVTATHLAGSIPDSKLDVISTSGKVAATAVEDKFLRNDADDTTVGTLTVKDLILYPETIPGTTASGKMFYNSSNNKLYYYNGTGWVEIYTGTSNVNSIAATLPITVTPATGDVVIAMSQADTTTDGWLSAIDWNTFNDKQVEIIWGYGLTYSAPTVSVLLYATDPGLEFDSLPPYGLRAKLKPFGGLETGPQGLFVSPIYAGFQAVYNFDPLRPDSRIQLDLGGSWTILNNNSTVSILEVNDGTIGTSIVSVSNLIVQGDLDVLGDNSRIRTTELYVKDRSISLGFENPLTGSPTEDTYINVLRGTDPQVGLRYNEISYRWEYTDDGTLWLPFNNGCIKFNLAFTALDTVTVVHNLNDLNPIIQVYDNAGTVIQPLEITTVDQWTSVVTFDAPQSGVIAVVGGVSASFGGGSTGRYVQYFNLPIPGTIVITAPMHGLGNTSDLLVQVSSFSAGVATLVEPNYVSIDSSGTVTLSFLAPIDGKVLIMK